MRRASSVRSRSAFKRALYAAIVHENTEKSLARASQREALTPAAVEIDDRRDSLEMARAADSALKGAVAQCP